MFIRQDHRHSDRALLLFPEQHNPVLHNLIGMEWRADSHQPLLICVRLLLFEGSRKISASKWPIFYHVLVELRRKKGKWHLLTSSSSYRDKFPHPSSYFDNNNCLTRVATFLNGRRELTFIESLVCIRNCAKHIFLIIIIIWWDEIT